VRAQLAVISALLVLGDRTRGGCHRYVEWLTALLAVVTLAGEAVHADGYSVSAGYIGRTIQTCYARWTQHADKPQLTFRIIRHCQLLLREMPNLFKMPVCLRWVRRRTCHRFAPPVPLDTDRAPLWQVRARLGGDDRRARAAVRPDRGPSDQRAGGLGAVRALLPNHAPPECIHPQCLQRSLAPPFASSGCPLQVRARREGPAGAGT
jgi:hypothetical protein